VNGVSASDLTDNSRQAIVPVTSCSDLESNFILVDINGRGLCRTNANADQPCPGNTYGVMIVPEIFQAGEKKSAFKVCGVCPAGESFLLQLGRSPSLLYLLDVCEAWSVASAACLPACGKLMPSPPIPAALLQAPRALSAPPPAMAAPPALPASTP